MLKYESVNKIYYDFRSITVHTIPLCFSSLEPIEIQPNFFPLLFGNFILYSILRYRTHSNPTFSIRGLFSPFLMYNNCPSPFSCLSLPFFLFLCDNKVKQLNTRLNMHI